MKPIPCIVCKRAIKGRWLEVADLFIANRPDGSEMRLCGRKECGEKYEEGDFR